MLVMILLKFPIYIAMLTPSIAYFILSDTSIFFVAQRLTSGMESVSLLACPFFIMAGVLYNHTGIADKLMGFCKLVTARTNGGLAQANILMSTLNGGMSGSSNADAAMDCKYLVPAMVRSGISLGFSGVITAFSSIITPLIPPGIGIILYGTLAGASVGTMFMWGFWIGIAMCVSMCIFTEFIARKRGYKPYMDHNPSLKQYAASIKESWPALLLPVIIIGSIRVGIVSASEAGAVAVVYAFILGLCWKEWNKEKFIMAIKESAVTTGSLMLIIGACAVYSWILTKEMLPQKLAVIMLEHINNKYTFMLVVNIFLLIVGMFMEGASATIILSPLLAPVAQMYGVNLVHFGMMLVFNMAIGGVTPPVGSMLFVVCGTLKLKVKDFLKEAVPYYIYAIVLLLIITYLPFTFTALYG